MPLDEGRLWLPSASLQESSLARGPSRPPAPAWAAGRARVRAALHRPRTTSRNSCNSSSRSWTRTCRWPFVPGMPLASLWPFRLGHAGASWCTGGRQLGLVPKWAGLGRAAPGGGVGTKPGGMQPGHRQCTSTWLIRVLGCLPARGRHGMIVHASCQHREKNTHNFFIYSFVY